MNEGEAQHRLFKGWQQKHPLRGRGQRWIRSAVLNVVHAVSSMDAHLVENAYVAMEHHPWQRTHESRLDHLTVACCARFREGRRTHVLGELDEAREPHAAQRTRCVCVMQFVVQRARMHVCMLRARAIELMHALAYRSTRLPTAVRLGSDGSVKQLEVEEEQEDVGDTAPELDPQFASAPSAGMAPIPRPPHEAWENDDTKLPDFDEDQYNQLNVGIGVEGGQQAGAPNANLGASGSSI